MASAPLTTEEQKAVEAFRRDVVAPSMEKLVIVDFWAEWCGPCKQLMPVLEKVAAAYADRGVVLVKVNVDENNFIASQFQVRSIPTVYAIYQGQPVADLSPARTEPHISSMIDQLLEKFQIQPSPGGQPPVQDVTPIIEAGEELLGNRGAEQAYALFAEILATQPEHPEALSGMIRALTQLNRLEEAASIYDSLDDRLKSHEALERARIAFTIAHDAVDPGEMASLAAAVEADPDDHQARFNLANAHMAAGKRDEAADALLHIIGADREWNDGAAKARLLQIFEMVGLEEPWVAATRRRLSAILFG